MILEQFKQSLEDQLVEACSAYLDQVRTELAGETIYAFVLFCTNGCAAVGATVHTVEALERRNSQTDADQARQFANEIYAAEWEFPTPHHELFDSVNELMDDFYDTLFDGQFDDYPIDEAISSEDLNEFSSDILVEIMIKVIKRLQGAEVFLGDRFVKDVLLGLQYPDPDTGEIPVMERVSKEVNSASWHDKIVRFWHDAQPY